MISISTDRDNTVKATETPNFDSFIQQNMPRKLFTPLPATNQANTIIIQNIGRETLNSMSLPQEINSLVVPLSLSIGSYVHNKQAFETAFGNFQNATLADNPDPVRIQNAGTRAIEANNASDDSNIRALDDIENLLNSVQRNENVNFEHFDKIQDLKEEIETYQEGSMERVNYIHALANEKGITL